MAISIKQLVKEACELTSLVAPGESVDGNMATVATTSSVIDSEPPKKLTRVSRRIKSSCSQIFHRYRKREDWQFFIRPRSRN